MFILRHVFWSPGASMLIGYWCYCISCSQLGLGRGNFHLFELHPFGRRSLLRSVLLTVVFAGSPWSPGVDWENCSNAVIRLIWWFPVIAQVAKDCHSYSNNCNNINICSCETRKIFQVRRTGWWPCTHSICKCFLWRKFFIGSLKLYGSFPWNFRPRLAGALVSPLGLPVVPGWLWAVDFWWLQTDLPNTRDTGDTWRPEKKNNEKSMAKFEIKEKYTRITTGNELMDGVPKSKQDFHDDKRTKMCQDGSRFAWMQDFWSARCFCTQGDLQGTVRNSVALSEVRPMHELPTPKTFNLKCY